MLLMLLNRKHETEGELLEFGSARQCTEETYLDNKETTYYGRALAVIRKVDESVVVSATGNTLPKTTKQF